MPSYKLPFTKRTAILSAFLFAALPALLAVTLYFNQDIREKAVETSPVTTNYYGTPVNVLKFFGQKDITEASRDTTVGNKIDHGAGVVVDRSTKPNKIYVIDKGNNRILGFRSMGFCSGSTTRECTNDTDCDAGTNCVVNSSRTADLVFGQPDLYHDACNGDSNMGIFKTPNERQLCLLRFPTVANVAEEWQRMSIEVDTAGNLYVPDVQNNRVLKFNQPFSANKTGGKGDTVADFVWGQDNFTSSKRNKGMQYLDNTSLFIDSDNFLPVTKGGVSVDASGNVWIADTFNARILRFPPGSKNADLVLGQPDFATASRSMCQQSTLFSLNRTCAPTLAKVNPATGELYVVDEFFRRAFESRILVFSPPFQNGMAATKVITPQFSGRLVNENQDYYMQTSGFTFNTYKQGEYANGVIWLNEHSANRTLLLDANGNILKALGVPDVNHKGCDYGYYGQCKGHESIFSNFNLCWPGGEIGLDDANNIYLADEGFHRISRFALPYTSQPVGDTMCVPNANGGLMDGKGHDNFNSVSGSEFTISGGLFTFQNTLVVKDKGRFMVWNDYLNKPNSSSADFIVGKSSFTERLPDERFRIAEHAYHVIDDANRLWTVNWSGKIVVYQMPFTAGSSNIPIANGVSLYWRDDGSAVTYDATRAGLAFDKNTRQLWLVDSRNHRLLRIQNYSDISSGQQLYVDMVIGQSDKVHVGCNQSLSGNDAIQNLPSKSSLCKPTFAKFDTNGNLFVIENDYECQGNNRITVFMGSDLRSAGGLFPTIEAKKVFVRSSLTQKADCTVEVKNGPRSPITLAFNSRNQMVVTSDGSYLSHFADNPERQIKQLWFYDNPLRTNADGAFVQGQQADAYIKVPIGVPAEISFDQNDNLIIEDGTWTRVWVINFLRDPFWLTYITADGLERPAPSVTPIIPTSIPNTPTPTITPTPIIRTITKKISVTSDDHYQLNNSSNPPTDVSAIYLGKNNTTNYYAALRFTDLGLSPTDTIRSAKLRVYPRYYLADSGGSKAGTIKIFADKSVNSTSPTQGVLASRPLTSSSVTWQVMTTNEGWGTSTPKDTTDLSLIIRELISQPGWTTTSPVTFILKDSSGPYWQLNAYENNQTYTATVVLEVQSLAGISPTITPTPGYFTPTPLATPTPVTVTFKVNTATNDHYQISGTNNQFTDQVYVGKNGTTSYTSAFRFTNITIPQGRTIRSAYLRLSAYSYIAGSSTNRSGSIKVYGEKVANSTAPNTGTISARPVTTANTTWTVMTSADTWATRTYKQSPSITTIIQELVNQSTWNTNNSLTLILKDGTTGYWSTNSFETQPAYGAELVVTY